MKIDIFNHLIPRKYYEALSKHLGKPYPAAEANPGIIDLDLDRNPETGVISLVDLNSPATTGLGIEIFVDLGTYLSSSQDMGVYDLAGEIIGVAPAQFGDSWVRIEIPRALLGSDGRVDMTAVFGTIGEPTDAVVNRGSVVTAPWSGSGPLSKSLDSVRSASNARSRSSVRSTRTRGWQGRQDYTQRQRRVEE